jgi:hypothetical protein
MISGVKNRDTVDRMLVAMEEIPSAMRGCNSRP